MSRRRDWESRHPYRPTPRPAPKPVVVDQPPVVKPAPVREEAAPVQPEAAPVVVNVEQQWLIGLVFLLVGLFIWIWR